METKEMPRKERGITLVALIITIIVLIILAAVSINAVLKTDFIGLATNGTINYAEAQVTEQKQMEDLNDKLDNVIAKIEKVSQPETFTGYGLEVEGNFEALRIFFEDIELIKFLRIDEVEEINKMTAEELVVIADGYNGTFEQYMEELYNAGNIPEKYSTVKELLIKGAGMTEAEAEAEIARIRREYIYEKINVDDIKIISPIRGTLNDRNDYLPIEVKDYVYQIEYLGKIYKMKVSIKPYEIVAGGSGIYALDVRNKKYLTIESAKINIYGKEVSVGSECLEEKDSYNYLELTKVSGLSRVILDKRSNGLVEFYLQRRNY